MPFGMVFVNPVTSYNVNMENALTTPKFILNSFHEFMFDSSLQKQACQQLTTRAWAQQPRW